MHLRPTRSETNQSVIPFSEEPFNNSSDRRDRTRSQRRGLNFRAEGRESGFDVAQTFAPGQLGESQHEKLFIGGEFADAAVAVVTGDTFVELVLGQEVEELSEDGATFVHKVKTCNATVLARAVGWRSSFASPTHCTRRNDWNHLRSVPPSAAPDGTTMRSSRLSRRPAAPTAFALLMVLLRLHNGVSDATIRKR